MRPQIGWINYTTVSDFVGSNKGTLPLGSMFLAALDLNRSNMEPTETGREIQTGSGSKQRGVSMIYAPQVNDQTFLHFSWGSEKGRESCALRDYTKTERLPQPIRRFRTSQIEQMIEKEVSFDRARPDHKQLEEWHNITMTLNQEHLSG